MIAFRVFAKLYVLMIAGRFRVAANTLLFSDSPVHSRTDQLSNIHGGDDVSSEDSSEDSSESMVGVQLGGQLGGRLGGCCPRFSSEGSDRAPPSPGCAGVFEWNTHSRPARIATIPSRCFAIQASRRGASLFTCR